MIHARHPGPGGQVQYGSVAGYGTPVVQDRPPDLTGFLTCLGCD